jgi:hypothetical protein
MFAAELFESSRCPPTISASALEMTTIPVDSLEAMIVMPETDLGAEKVGLWDLSSSRVAGPSVPCL